MANTYKLSFANKAVSIKGIAYAESVEAVISALGDIRVSQAKAGRPKKAATAVKES